MIAFCMACGKSFDVPTPLAGLYVLPDACEECVTKRKNKNMKCARCRAKAIGYIDGRPLCDNCASDGARAEAQQYQKPWTR